MRLDLRWPSSRSVQTSLQMHPSSFSAPSPSTLLSNFYGGNCLINIGTEGSRISGDGARREAGVFLCFVLCAIYATFCKMLALFIMKEKEEDLLF